MLSSQFPDWQGLARFPRLTARSKLLPVITIWFELLWLSELKNVVCSATKRKLNWKPWRTDSILQAKYQLTMLIGASWISNTFSKLPLWKEEDPDYQNCKPTRVNSWKKLVNLSDLGSKTNPQALEAEHHPFMNELPSYCAYFPCFPASFFLPVKPKITNNSFQDLTFFLSTQVQKETSSNSRKNIAL